MLSKTFGHRPGLPSWNLVSRLWASPNRVSFVVPRPPAGFLVTWVAVFMLLVVVGLLDWVITTDVSVSLLYLVPVLMAAWYLGFRTALAVAVAAAVVWYMAEAWGRPVSDPGAAWQSVSRFGFYALSAYLVHRVRVLTLGLESLVQVRTLALESEVVRRKQLEEETAEIAEREQERIAHELHDELAAYMSGIAFRAKTMAEDLDARGEREAEDAKNLVQLINSATQQVRSFSRLLAPMEGSRPDLAAALSSLGNEIETAFRITCTVELPPDLSRVTGDQATQLYRIAQEAVRNAIQHAKAELVQIRVTAEPDQLVLSVKSDGKAWQEPNRPSAGMGLRIMQHRTQRLGGRLAIDANPAGGASVRCEVPWL